MPRCSSLQPGSSSARSSADCDEWACAKCGEIYHYRRTRADIRGGPAQRGIDRRYGIGSCWRGSGPHKGEVTIFVGPGVPNPAQPQQDDGQ